MADARELAERARYLEAEIAERQVALSMIWPRPARPEKTAKMLVAVEQGGRWLVLDVHSFVTPDGQRWDALNGWTGQVNYSVEEVEQNQADARQKVEEKPEAPKKGRDAA